ncbi:MAG: ATP-dependent protease ATPase subunit HslU ['Candidatus Kapabacteria' thiocyanatum]|uniref:ATP-dependent protease ATPase subunit HslU n=1 Tax=Candidatus Kapaibacterium thiocyanatum TaxID=1895771 RepID=A0A1M3L150_9BACT|nr:ATP-dependent protease ATPase subunit HslU ['Candidatus Kapabacteria' thiocyanatum]OJX58659.1 MAG: HslU--HslV peptidase ATPase subunit ['Candidatus Kapabacteria' thiocyanatum]
MNLTPHQIVAELDKYVIGQQAAKKAVAIALRNRWRRQQVEGDLQHEIMPNNIIMIGPTGVGKTEIARRLARLAGAPFVKVEATKYTEVGYVGRDVETMIRDLVEGAVSMVRTEHLQTVREQATAAAEQQILDILVPPVNTTMSFDLTGGQTENQQREQREQVRTMLQSGMMDDRVIEIDVKVDNMPGLNVLGPIGPEGFDMNIGEMLSGMMPKRFKKRRVTIAEARVIIEEQEAEKLVDMEKVTKEAIYRAENMGIVFIDEIDKVAVRSGTSGGVDVSREGVQRDLLPIVEGSAVNTKYGPVKTDHILFIASGAFHVAKPSDLIPELQGRFPIRVELQSLTVEDFVAILTQPEHALIKQYSALMRSEGYELIFDEGAIRAIASTAARVNEDVANIGARRLHTILTTLLEETLFHAPDSVEGPTISITADVVGERLSSIVQNSDLSHYIL